MKVAIAQMKVLAGQPQVNFEKMESMISEAKNQQADLIVFPEMCVSGYFLADKYNDEYFVEILLSYNEKIKNLSEGIAIIYGNIVVDKDYCGHDGRVAKYNGAYFCQNKSWVQRLDGSQGIYVKHLLPNYSVFDDSRYFLSGLEKAKRNGKNHECVPFLLNVNGVDKKIGIQICEDLWSADYDVDVTGLLIKQDVDIIINISASPWTLEKESSRENQIYRYAHKAEIPLFLYVNAVGMQNTGKTICLFDGNSSLYNKKGNCVISCNDQFAEELKIQDVTTEDLAEKKENKLLHALIYACQEVDKQWFNQKVRWIVGLSGGLDSTITTSLLVAALGKERVIGYNMATQYNSEKTKDNARMIAQNLGIEFREGNIESIVNATISTTKEYDYSGANNGIVLENIQARVRGNLLSTFAALEGGVIVNNGNKLEIALGYCTLYGDSIGVFSPIGDCTKVQLFELGHQLNEYFEKEAVPLNLLPQLKDGKVFWETPPTAELRDNQVDPMKWFYHDWLLTKLMNYPAWQINEVKQMYYSGELSQSETGMWLKYYGLDDEKSFLEDLEWFVSTIQKAVFKRIQMPPIVLISKGGFGSDFREVQGIFEK